MSGIFGLIRSALRLERTKVGMRPHREFVVPVDRAQAFVRAREALERTIGANVYRADEREGTIEAAFGLVNHERLIVTLEATADARTRLVVEAFYPAGVKRPARSHAVDVLADALEAGITA
jgi:hypothetical protein